MIPDIESIPSAPGAYQLVLCLPEEVRLEVGSLGVFSFPAGRYVYTGSAMGGLRARIARHLRREKRLRWHIDYLLTVAQVEQVHLYPSSYRVECELNRQILRQSGAQVVVPGFGSSDCRCPSHLVYVEPCAGL